MMPDVTVGQLVERERESTMRAGHLLMNLAIVYRHEVEAGTAVSPMAVAEMSRRCREASQTITLVLRSFGMTDDDIMELAKSIDREQAALATLQDDA